MKQLSKMNSTEYTKYHREQVKKQQSEFLKLVMVIGDKKFIQNGKQIYKWELFALGIREFNYPVSLKKFNITIKNENT